MIGLALKLALSPAGKALGAVLAVALVCGGLYLWGHHDGRQAVLDRLAADRITILKDGKAIDHEVLDADDDGLCALLGGCV